jgi:peptidoglycan hydrolase-like protein with peptidoglycan-binding domain
VLVAVAAVAALAVPTALYLRGATEPAPAVAAAPALPTVPVTTGDMVQATSARGTLHHAQEATVGAAAAGVVTALPAAGSVIAPGGTLYRVDERPVVLLRGALPAWRAFEAGMTPGEDVRQLEENLIALGVLRGEADARFTRATATAVSAWQQALGVERTGRLERTAVLFADHDLRVAQVTAALGAEVGPGVPLYTVSSTTKVVDLDLRLSDQQLAVVGTPVGLTLPDGTTTTGTVAAVGEPVERGGDDAAQGASSGATFVVPVTVAVTDQAAVGAVGRATVTVQFSSTLADDVLTVPVEALVATDATSFAVETPEGADDGAVRTLPVTVGAFAAGRVQVTGDGVREGLAVVVPAP